MLLGAMALSEGGGRAFGGDAILAASGEAVIAAAAGVLCLPAKCSTANCWCRPTLQVATCVVDAHMFERINSGEICRRAINLVYSINHVAIKYHV
jgi:hypothetical protein